MARIPKGTDSAGNVLPDGRFTIGLSDGSELTGTQGVIKLVPGQDTVVITTRLSRVPASLDTVMISLPQGEPFRVVVGDVHTLPNGRTQVTGRIS
jgi:hypothetical protein